MQPERWYIRPGPCLQVLVMDKYTAADVLREVSVYDTINKAGNYSAKVHAAQCAICCAPSASQVVTQGANPGCTAGCRQSRSIGNENSRLQASNARLLRFALV